MATEAKESARPVDVPEASGTPVRLRDRYDIYPDSPLPSLSSPNADAFLAQDRRDLSRPLFALICRPELPIRLNAMRSLRGAQATGLLQLVEWSKIHWPPSGATTVAVVYERPLGGRVVTSIDAEIRRIDEYEIGKLVITPLTAALKELFGRGITHRAVRPTNMFWQDAGQRSIVLGECVTAPPAMDQPVLFEPTESGMSWPSARGGGEHRDDLYALGVSLVFLLLGRNPLGGRDDEAILRAKSVHGSYNALVGDQRLPLSMIEVLRGLLADDAGQRWDLEKLELWLTGRRMSPQQAKVQKKAQRSFTFCGQEYFTAPELAMGLARNWQEAGPVVVEGRLELWVRRALEDKEKANAIADAVGATMATTPDQKVGMDIAVARVCMILDPRAPIRYKGFAGLVMGLGPALALMMARQEDPNVLGELILRDIPSLWFASRQHYDPQHSLLQGTVRELRDHLRNRGFGGGLERCLYELNETLPCRSPLIAEAYVTEPKELLPALDEAAKKAANKTLPVDRHVAAYAAARFRFDLGQPLKLLSNDLPEKRVEGMLGLLAIIQWRLGPDRLPGLARWAGTLSTPIVATYHNRERRRRMERELPKVIRSGSLVEIFNLLDNPEERQNDEAEFQEAVAEYSQAEVEIAQLQTPDEEAERQTLETGQQVAAMISAGLGFLAAVAMTVTKVL